MYNFHPKSQQESQSSYRKNGVLSDMFKTANWLLLIWCHSDSRSNLLKLSEALNKTLDIILSLQTLPCLSAEVSNSLINHQWIQVALLWPSSSPSQALKLSFHFYHSKDVGSVWGDTRVCGKAWCQNVSLAGRAASKHHIWTKKPGVSMGNWDKPLD